jgi:hypothetical protein
VKTGKEKGRTYKNKTWVPSLQMTPYSLLQGTPVITLTKRTVHPGDSFEDTVPLLSRGSTFSNFNQIVESALYGFAIEEREVDPFEISDTI